MIRTLLYDRNTNTLSEGGREAVEVWRTNPDTVIWVDLQDEEPATERALMESDFGLHPLAVHDVTRDRHPPKIEEFDDNLFVLLRGLDKDTSNINFGVIQLGMFVGERFLVTRHNKDSVSTDAIWDDVLATSPAAMACDFVAVKLLSRVVRRFIGVLLSLEPRLDELEQEIFANPSDKLLAELTGYKSRLRQLRRIANYHLQVAAELRGGKRLISSELTHELADVYEQLERSLSLAQLYYESACDLTDGYLASASHNLNRVMQILTIFTVMFVPLTFLAGIYGMNFENMPELHSNSGYFIVIAVMIVIVIVQLIFFKRKRWI